MALYQQGDVLIQAVDEIPADAIRLDPAQHRNTLAEGEVTGHAHRVEGFIELFRQANTPGEDVFMSAPKRIVLRHDEHKPIVLPKGSYKVGRIREYDHLAEEARIVQD